MALRVYLHSWLLGLPNVPGKVKRPVMFHVTHEKTILAARNSLVAIHSSHSRRLLPLSFNPIYVSVF